MKRTAPRTPARHTRAEASSGLPWSWAVLGLLAGVVVSIVVFAPAAWLSHAVAAATGGKVVLADARGSVWKGSAQLVFTGGQGASDASALPGRIDWSMRPSITGLLARVNSSCCSAQPATLQIQPGVQSSKLDVAQLQLKLPAAVLTGLGTPWNTMDMQGDLIITAPQMQIGVESGRLQVQGQATLDALAISSRISTLRPLGDYRLSLAGGEVPTLVLQTLQGALQLSGSGQVVGGNLRFNGEASAAPEREAALANLLNIIGRRQGAKSIISLG
jgi:general secretion pathway protein N